MVREDKRTYELENGQSVTVDVLIVEAKLKAIPSQVRTLNNQKKTQWRLATVEIDMNGTITEANAQLFEKSYEMYPDNFVPGATIELEVQTDGDNAGYAKVQLPSAKRVDVNALKALLATSAQPTEAL